jgi:hypothetical protein
VIPHTAAVHQRIVGIPRIGAALQPCGGFHLPPEEQTNNRQKFPAPELQGDFNKALEEQMNHYL